MSMEVSSWTPLADERSRPVDAIIVSYLQRREVNLLAGRDSPYRHHSVVAAAKRTFLLEDHACEGRGFSERLIELFRESGYSLSRIPEEDTESLTRRDHPDYSEWKACATHCSIVRGRYLENEVVLVFRVESREASGDGANVRFYWSGEKSVGYAISFVHGSRLHDHIDQAVSSDPSRIDFVQKMLTDTHPNIKLAGEVLEIAPEARPMPEPVPADVEESQSCWEQLCSCLGGIGKGILSVFAALFACLTCWYYSEEREQEV